MSKDQKIALVTGASRGIGKAVALKLASENNLVIGTATTEEGAHNISQSFVAAGFKGYGMVVDVTQRAAIDNLLAAIVDQYGHPSILVNNAAITRDALLLRMEDDEWDNTIAANLSAVYYLCKACVKHMFRSRWGRIINISSVVALTGNVGQANYTAAKAGVIGFSKSLAQEIASRGVTVNVIAPGFIDTDMTRVLPDAVGEELMKRIPMRHLGTPEDIAAAVSFLASDAASYITGHTLHVNGGMHMA